MTDRDTPTAAVALVLLLVSLPGPTRAWGPTGHRVVGAIAESHLSDEARAAVRDLLGPESLARASTWADEIRSDREWSRAAPWHYINIADDETLETTRRSSRGDVLSAMERFEGVLRDPEASRQDRVEALRFLVHFVGDVHQPLHVGRASDAGGNRIVVLWFGEATNLHTLWDSDLIRSMELSYTELAEFLDHPEPDQVAEWQASGYRDWIAESFGLRDEVYELGDRRLGYDYLRAKTPIVERRLLQAGVRLAGLLNSIFRPDS